MGGVNGLSDQSSSRGSGPTERRSVPRTKSKTRTRIVEAAVALHATLGPARTNVSAVAEHAGVTRATVYRHFPDDESLFLACSSHWMSRQRLPDPDAWTAIDEPLARLHAGLIERLPLLPRWRADDHAHPPTTRRPYHPRSWRTGWSRNSDGWRRSCSPFRIAAAERFGSRRACRRVLHLALPVRRTRPSEQIRHRLMVGTGRQGMRQRSPRHVTTAVRRRVSTGGRASGPLVSAPLPATAGQVVVVRQPVLRTAEPSVQNAKCGPRARGQRLPCACACPREAPAHRARHRSPRGRRGRLARPLRPAP